VRYFLLILFFLAGAADLYFVQMDMDYRVFSKPLIMVSLIGYFLLHWTVLKESASKKLFLLALVGALMGDIFLLDDNYFVFGILSFLMMQGLYVACFLRDGKTNKNAQMAIVLLVPFSLYMLFLMWSNLDEMKIPVIIYLIAILSMAISAAGRKSSWRGYRMVLLGTLLFVISDSVLALHKFTPDIRLGSMTVMATYIAAQYLIVEGYLFAHTSSKTSA